MHNLLHIHIGHFYTRVYVDFALYSAENTRRIRVDVIIIFTYFRRRTLDAETTEFTQQYGTQL